MQWQQGSTRLNGRPIDPSGPFSLLVLPRGSWRISAAGADRRSFSALLPQPLSFSSLPLPLPPLPGFPDAATSLIIQPVVSPCTLFSSYIFVRSGNPLLTPH